jgi:hypothetical protein
MLEITENPQSRRIPDFAAVIKTTGQFYQLGFFLKIMNEAFGNIVVSQDDHIFCQLEFASQGNNQQVKYEPVEKKNSCKGRKTKNDKKPGILIMENKYKKKEKGNRENITLESPLKEYFKVKPVLAHIELSKIYRGHPNQIKYGKEQVILWQVDGIRTDDRDAGK